MEFDWNLEKGDMVDGCDWNNAPEPDPCFAREGMITRKKPAPPEQGSLNPAERIAVKKAIKVFTLNGAHNIEAEDESRSMEVGKSEDFILLNQNLMEIPVEKIHKTKLMQTVLQGKTVYQRT